MSGCLFFCAVNSITNKYASVIIIVPLLGMCPKEIVYAPVDKGVHTVWSSVAYVMEN